MYIITGFKIFFAAGLSLLQFLGEEIKRFVDLRLLKSNYSLRIRAIKCILCYFYGREHSDVLINEQERPCRLCET